MMKIVIQSINFYPELTGVGKYAGEMAAWLSEKGHDVRVITAHPYYPEWKLKSGYKSLFWSREVWCGVTILRCPILVPKKPTGAKRLLHLFSFALSSMPVIIWQIFWRPNIILTVEPPIVVSPYALLVAKICGAKSILHIQDFEIDAAFELGILKEVWIKKIANKIEKNIMQNFDLVCTISNKMVEKVLIKGVKNDNVILLPNWVSTPKNHYSLQNVSNCEQKKEPYRKRLNLPEHDLIALYSGNMGEKQGLEILGQVARKFMKADKSTPRVCFVFCGDGVGRNKLIEQCVDLNYVYFLDLQPAENLADFLAMADIHLLPQRADVADLVMPSKLTGMMASARPILACAKNGTELADTVNRCGLVVAPEDSQSLYEALVKLLASKQLRLELGLEGQKYAAKFLDMNIILSGFELKLKELLIE